MNSPRPRSQREIRNASQVLAAGAAGSLDSHSSHHRHDVASEISGVSLGRQIAVRSRALEAARGRRPLTQAALRPLPVERIRTSLRKRALSLHDETSAGSAIGHQVDRPAQQAFSSAEEPSASFRASRTKAAGPLT